MQLSSPHPHDHDPSELHAADSAEPSVPSSVRRNIPLVVPIAAVLLLVASALVWHLVL